MEHCPFKTNCLQSGLKEISNNRSRPLLKLSRRPLPKRNCCQSAPPKHLPERALRKLSRRVLPKRNWYQTGPSTTPNYLSGLLLKLSRRSLQNKTAAKSGPRWHSTAGLALRRLSRQKKNCWNGPPEHPPAGAGPTEAIKTESVNTYSKTKLQPNGALSNIEIPRRVLTTGAGPIAAHHQDEALPKRSCCINGSTTSNYRSGPLPKQSRQALPKRNCC